MVFAGYSKLFHATGGIGIVEVILSDIGGRKPENMGAACLVRIRLCTILDLLVKQNKLKIAPL